MNTFIYFQIFSILSLISLGSAAEKGFKCYGCLAGPLLSSTSEHDKNCKSGNLERENQYICTIENSRNAQTLQLLTPSEISNITLGSEKAEIPFIFGCAKATFQHSGNGSDLFTVRGCVFEQFSDLEAVCEPKNGKQDWLAMLRPNQANLPIGKPIRVEELLPANVSIKSELCTCFTDACNGSSKIGATNLAFLLSFLALIIKSVVRTY